MVKAVTFSGLGNLGSIGNQMFQYACLYALSEELGVQRVIPDKRDEYVEDYGRINHYIGNYFDLDAKKKRDISYDAQVSVKSFNYVDLTVPLGSQDVTETENYILQGWGGVTDKSIVDINGYFQSEKYFVNHRASILNEFRFKQEDIDNCSLFATRNKIDFNNAIAVHFRRGDYLNKSQFHNNLDLDYYHEALFNIVKATQNNRDILVFSDDIQWPKNNFKTALGRIHYITNETPYQDLCMMSLCRDFIIANSSFSWWAAYLGEKFDSIVMAPQNWFGPANLYLDTRDLIPQGWVLF